MGQYNFMSDCEIYQGLPNMKLFLEHSEEMDSSYFHFKQEYMY